MLDSDRDEALKSLPEKDREGSNILRGKRYCDKLFELERKFADLTPKERLAQRQEVAKPLLDEFFAWIDLLNAVPKTHLGVAANYTLGQRKYLARYLLDGRLEISNNRAERSIKPFVISRKNFLFANTPRGAKASAIMFSIIETAKESGLNPFAYLAYIFQNAPNWDIRNNVNYLDLLMPYSVPNFCKAGNSRSSPNDVEQAFLRRMELTGSSPQNHRNQIVNIAKTKAAANHRFDDIVGCLKLAS